MKNHLNDLNFNKKRTRKTAQHPTPRRWRNQSLGYGVLEDRLPLDASFVFTPGDSLLLEAFSSDVTLSNNGVELSAVLAGGTWRGEDPTEDFSAEGEPDPENFDIRGIGTSTLTLPNEFFTTLTVNDLGQRTLTFGQASFEQTVTIDSPSSFRIDQTGPLNVADLTISSSSNASVDLTGLGNRLNTLNVNVGGEARVNSAFTINGDAFTAGSVSIESNNSVNYRAISASASNANLSIVVGNSLTVTDSILAGGEIVIVAGTNTSIGGNVGHGTTDSIRIDALSLTVDGNVTALGDVFIATTANLTVLGNVDSDTEIVLSSNIGSARIDGSVGNSTTTTAIDVDAMSISVGNVLTQFTPIAADVNGLRGNPDAPNTTVRLRATGGRPVIGVPGSDRPILRDNTAGGIVLTGSLRGEAVALQSSNGISFSQTNSNIDAFYLYLGGDIEAESRGEFQINAPSLQYLSANLYDGFAITSQQDLVIGDRTFTGRAVPNDDQEFTAAYSDLYANITAKTLTFATPFQSQKLVADITTDIRQNADAILEVDDLNLSAKRVVFDNVDNDFERIAFLGKGFIADDRTNNEDILTIRDKGTLEIATLDNQPDDRLVVNFGSPIATTTTSGIQAAGQVDIQTGLGGPAPMQPVDAVQPTSAQLGNSAASPNLYGIEKFEVPRDRSGTSTGVFRADNYNGAIRPVYFIEFFYDGTSDLSIQTDEFERGNPERVRGFIDTELALYNDRGELIARSDDNIDRELAQLKFPLFDENGVASALPTGRYFVAASAFSAEFEEGFVVKTANRQTGTINITINGNAAVAPELSRDLTQAMDAPLIVTGGEQIDDDETETDGTARLSAIGGEISLDHSELNDVRKIIVGSARGIEYVDADGLIVGSEMDPVGTPLFQGDFARLSAGRNGGGGMLTVGNLSADEALLQGDGGIVSTGELNIRKLLIGGSEARDSGGDLAIISPQTTELAFQFADSVAADGTLSLDSDFAVATNQDLTIGSFEYRDSGIVLSQSRADKLRIQAQSLAVTSTLEAVTKMVIEVDDSLTVNALADTPGITTPELFFTGTTLNLSSNDNPIARLAVQTDGPEGEFKLKSSVATHVAALDNSIDIETLPTSMELSFKPTKTVAGIHARKGLDLNVLSLTQDVGARLVGNALTINAVGDVTLPESNSIGQLSIPTAAAVSFNNERQFTSRVINATADVSLQSETGDIVVESITTPVAASVTLTAADDVRDTHPMDGNRITTGRLTVVADNHNIESTFNGVLLQTEVDNIDVAVSTVDSGEVILRELTGLTLDRIVAGRGKINLVANGTVNANQLRFNSSDADNEILINAAGPESDIVVSVIDAAAGDVKLFAADDVYHAPQPELDPAAPANPSALPGLRLVSGFDLFTFARNQTADNDSGIHLNTRVVSATAVVDQFTNATPSAGSITINEMDGIRVDLAKTRNGSINITSAQNLVAKFVQAEGVNVGDAVTLTTTGIGGDVVPERVVSRGGTGAITINAADDIRDSNPLDDISLTAKSITLVAQNNLQDAFDGIIAQTRTSYLSAQVTSSTIAQMHLFNRGAMLLDNTFVNHGSVNVTNSHGNLSAKDVRSGGQGNSRIFLRTLGTGADMSIGRLFAADRGEVILDSADDIFDSNFVDDLFVEAEFLSATSRNNRMEDFDGVLLNGAVSEVAVARPNGGEKIIRRR